MPRHPWDLARNLKRGERAHMLRGSQPLPLGKGRCMFRQRELTT
eukprot:CAMPEP_0171256718 /NCGR_PEP_ID=MMETSP0790-20130122/53457_1 /TAXON_ID=2925 /ORGANISM="Alexandrium catenella, Strain OF101" /LENGTH=43 /DNA_ID= /DNA_START= /DNA_END= /DNA_ORIENTATION=